MSQQDQRQFVGVGVCSDDSYWNLSQQNSSGYAVRFLCALIFFKLLRSVKNTVLLFLNSGVKSFAAVN